MEHFRRWGLAGRIRQAAPVPVSWSQDAVFCTSLVGREITRFHGCFSLTPRRVDIFAESSQQVPQPVVESVLREALWRQPSVKLALGLRATAIVETATHVDVAARSAGGEHLIRARYVLGCDGSSGLVRAAIGARYQGTTDTRENFTVVFRASRLAEKVLHGPAVHYWVVNEDSPGLVGRLDLGETWFASFTGVAEEIGTTQVHRLINGLVGTDISAEIVATDYWSARTLIADTFASDRVFLVGDAAHLSPPWGGHGFNTGVGDAVNIGWKLAAVVAGWADSTLLASYETERRGVAQRTTAVSADHLRRAPADLAIPMLTAEGREGEAARGIAAAAIQEHKKSEFRSLGLVLGYHYADSPIVAHEDTPYPSDDSTHYRATARPGARLPHAWLSDGKSLFDRLGQDYTLLRVGDADPEPLIRAARSADVPLEHLDLTGELHQQPYGAPLLLVRPDQHVAWRGDGRSIQPQRFVSIMRGRNG